MVHGASSANNSDRMESDAMLHTSLETSEPIERIEDLLEEVEECEDGQTEMEDYNEDIERFNEDIEIEKTIENEAASSKDKTKFFACNKCNYVTHIRARYTKHVKYHSMPMIKCTTCDFRTPYKWNLDRHMKNHGGGGSFICSMCNFTADIKQSLTVHEMNHHSPPASRRRNRVGASDMALADAAAVPVEEEGSGDSRSSHSASDMCLQYAEKEIVSCNSDSNDTMAHETGSKRDASHMHRDSTSPAMSDDSKSCKHNKKPARPIPQLIPLNASTPNQTKSTSNEPPAKKFKESIESNTNTKFENLPTDITLIPMNSLSSNTKETVGRKKNNSFFDKLKERLLTETGEEGSLVCKNCGFESKCLSEHSVHEKNCTALSNRVVANTLMPSVSSTRCQNCRHRCKSSADLFIHMKTCGKNKVESGQFLDTGNQDSNETTPSNQDKEIEPHPMENVVFVWNNIDHDASKFDTPLGININEESAITEITDENESMNLSPSQAVGKKVFKCPHCPFWASTASRFHVHIVGHLNKKPFECSLCKYKSNWRWDITKHIKLKSARDPEHNEAKVLMTDETGRRNYSKYNKFLAMPVLNENGENEFHYIDQSALSEGAMEIDDTYNDQHDGLHNTPYEVQPLNLQTQISDRGEDPKKQKKTLWKCKKCNYKDPSKEALLDHVREHSKIEGLDDKLMTSGKKGDNIPDPTDLAYRCGHCNQLSNWKHVIQRHCRLKHDGIIKVITTVKPKGDELGSMPMHDMNGDACNKCPFRTNDKKAMWIHAQQHQPSPLSIFKCYFCPYFVKNEQELMNHLVLHGVTDPEDYIAKAMGCKSPLPDSNTPPGSTKRHRCIECPYETNSKSQFMYHEQFHRLPADTPYKCPECNYSVSKRHLLHQHMRVHGIYAKKGEDELEASSSFSKSDSKTDISFSLDEIPYVWVSAKNEFHKMYKCRYCSYVNSQKCKIPNHEKIHWIFFENSELTVYKCLECKFTCDVAGRLTEHSKIHGEIYGRIYCHVEEDVPDEEQIAKLRKVIEIEKSTNSEPAVNDENSVFKENKILYFCQKCPARFFFNSELKVHDKFHSLSFTYKCKSCEFSMIQENELIAHLSVHSDEYNTKTKMLKFMHCSHPAHTEPELVRCPLTSDVAWVVKSPGKNYVPPEFASRKSSDSRHVPKQYYCKECPAKFFKTSALSYHVALHGGEGEHKCKKCSYAVKNVGNLAKHELLHENEGKPACDYDSGEDVDYKIPLSGTDLFQRKTEAQKKRNLIDKDKLVKPNDHFPPVLQADPQFGYLMHGNPEFIYPTYLKNGRQKEKRYKCHKCPSAFEKREQYKIHLSLHGSKQRYKCELCDYSVKYYANYVQHMRKHQMNDEAQAERNKGSNGFAETETSETKTQDTVDNVKLAIKTMPKAAPKSDFQQFSIGDQQTLRLLQRRRSINNSAKDGTAVEHSPTKNRKMHMCLLCPYTNQRQDALSNHYRRHDEADILNAGNHKCSYCDLIVVQSHFLREHLKTHFLYQKSLTPECFVANENVTFTITKVDDEDVSTDLKLQSQSFKCNDDKIFVKIKTGELLVE